MAAASGNDSCAVMRVCPLCNLRYPNDRTSCFVDGAALEELKDERLGQVLAGRYQIESLLGEGGMATVYAARHRLVEQRCAIKILNDSLAKNEVMRERFRREAKAAQKLAHPNIIEIFDQGETEDGCVYLVMELLHGQPLAGLLERGKVPIARTLRIAVQIARALARAHDLQVIHRDLKPENIYLAEDPHSPQEEVVKLLDFGIARSMEDARLTGTGELFGTPQYMAPERITSIDAGPSADLYAVGVILFEMLTGRLPFVSEHLPVLFTKHLTEAPPTVRSLAPEIPEVLEKLVLELLAKDPKDRPVDAHRLYKDLVSVAEALGVELPRDPADAPTSSRPPSKSLPPVGLDLWLRRVDVFRQMLTQAYAAGPPLATAQLFERVEQLVSQLQARREDGMGHERKLENLEARMRELRQQIGHAVHALGLDASLARDRLKEAQAQAKLLAPAVVEAQRAFRTAHKELVFWEGRSGFLEPYRELAEAYRASATAVDRWLEHKRAEHAVVAEATRAKGEVEDLEFQINQLRQAMTTQEESFEAEQAACQRAVEEMGSHHHALENELLELATRFCEPLRNLPELKALFRELEAEQEAAA
jgi:serine/threonine protein kinase